jgi:23S rRNA pseudouridine955/2504/2580 synthase
MDVPDIQDGIIDLPICKQPGSGGEKMHVSQKDGAPSRTRIRVIDIAGNRCAWVECQPLTGRTHQIRVHLAAIGHPIVGDGKYGGRDAFLTGGISRKMHLHARRIRVDHPDAGQIDVTADLPTHFAESLTQLGFELHQGDSMVLDEVKFSDTPEGKKRVVAQKAKAARKARKGERRNRSRD